jgi:hypothetical protein
MADTPRDGYTSAGKPIPQFWIEAVAKGKTFRRTYAHEESWPMWRRWYRGEWQPTILPSNVYFKMMRTLVPRIYYRNPSVSLTPSKPGVENMLLSKLLERADNKLIDVMGVKQQMKRAVQHAVMFGTGGLRLGFGAEFTPTPDDIDTSGPDTGGRRVKKRVEYNDLVHPNMPWLLAAHPGQVVVPHNTVDIHSARWVCFEDIRTLDDIKADPRFENTKDLMSGITEGRLLARTQAMSDRNREGVILWEIRDKKTGLVFVMAPHAVNTRAADKVLFCEEDSLQVSGRLPYYPLVFNTDDEVFWGVSDSQILSPQQGEINEIRTQIRNHRRVAIAKILSEIGAISPDEESKLIDGNSSGVIHVKNINGVKELQPLAIPQALIEATGLLGQEVQELLGLGVNQFGEYAPGSADRSATEANIVAQATQIRIDERRDACADLLVDVVSDMNHVIIEHWDSEMVMDIVGPEGVQLWVKFQPSLLREAIYDVKIDPDTSLPLTKQLREQKADAFYERAKMNPLLDPMLLTKFWLGEQYGVDADHMVREQAANTSQQNPMDVNGAMQLMQQGQQGGPRRVA